jgi:hypothetical protein
VSKNAFSALSSREMIILVLVMNTATKLGKIVVGMNRALGEIPLTVKLRTGIK